MSSQPVPAASFAMSLRILAAALLGAPVMIGLVLLFVLGAEDGSGESGLTAAPDPLFAGIVLVVGAALFAVVPAIGYNLRPLAPGTDEETARREAQGRFQAATILRFALAEAPVLVGIVLAFLDDNYLLYLAGAVLGLALMALHVWPSRKVVEKSAELLEANGVDSGLRREFGHSPA